MCLPKVKSKAVLAALSISLICFGHAASAAIILLGGVESIDNIDVIASVDTPSGSLVESASETSPDGISDFDDLVEASVSLPDGSASAFAQQTSQFNATSILASGEAKVSAELTVSDPEFTSGAQGRGLSTFRVAFELTTPYNFHLSGLLSSSNPSELEDGAAVQLGSNEGTVSVFLRTPSFGTGETIPFDLSSTLFPGTYNLVASAQSSVFAFNGVQPTVTSGSSNFSLGMQFTPIPIPAPLLLFCSGLLGLIGIARRKKAA